MTKLLEAAKAVVENWYQNKAVVDSIEALLQAVQAEPLYTAPPSVEHEKWLREQAEDFCRAVQDQRDTYAANLEALITELMELNLTYPDYLDVKEVCNKYRNKK